MTPEDQINITTKNGEKALGRLCEARIPRGVPMSLSRRNFLRNTRNALVGTLAFSNGAIALLAPSRAWSMPLQILSTAEGETILKRRGRTFDRAFEQAFDRAFESSIESWFS